MSARVHLGRPRIKVFAGELCVGTVERPAGQPGPALTLALAPVERSMTQLIANGGVRDEPLTLSLPLQLAMVDGGWAMEAVLAVPDGTPEATWRRLQGLRPLRPRNDDPGALIPYTPYGSF